MSLPSNASRHRFTTGITRKTWLSTVEDTDRIAVRNLSSTPNSGYDVWGRKKRQPALLSLTVYLKHTFDQAARSDSVDTSTVHYGILSKKVLAVIEKYSEWQLTYHLAREILSGAYLVAGANSLKGCELDLFYPKACMQGDGAGLIFSTTDHGFFNTLYLKNVRISCLIGVNSNERLAKQPVIANLWIESIRKEQCDEYGAAEKILIEVRCRQTTLDRD
jgi:dihydroneopterin aldolase